MATAQTSAGRPPGSRNPDLQEQVRRAVPRIYSSLIKRAEAGDAEAARLCFEIVMQPKRFPVGVE